MRPRPAPVKTASVTVSKGVQLYTGPGALPHREGAVLDIPEDHVDALVTAQRVTRTVKADDKRPEPDGKPAK